MNSAIVFLFAAALAAPALAAWGPAPNWAAAPAPANIALSNDGQNVLDTPEVANARAAHFAAVQQAAALSGKDNDDGSYDPRWEQESQPAPQQWSAAPAPQQWSAAPAHQQWSAAPAPQQWNAPAQQQQWSAPAAPAYSKWANTNANIALSADGQHVLDTPEVAQARAAHLAAYAALKSAAPAAPATHNQQWNAPAPQQWNAAPAPQQWNAAPAPQQWNAPAPVASHAAPQQWNGAPSWQAAPARQNWAASPAQISLSQDGQNVLDTPEVAQARAAHLAAHAAAQAAAPPAHASAQPHW